MVGTLVHAHFPTMHDGVRVEVDPDKLLKAVASAIADLGAAGPESRAIGLSVMSPAWVAMDAQRASR